MSKASEDYLDQLLNSVQKQQNKEETLDGASEGRKKKHFRTQEDFIRELEQELNSMDEEKLISDFEFSLEPELFSDEKGEGFPAGRPLPAEMLYPKKKKPVAEKQPLPKEQETLEDQSFSMEQESLEEQPLPKEQESVEEQSVEEQPSPEEQSFFRGLDAVMNEDEDEPLADTDKYADTGAGTDAGTDAGIDVGGLSLDDFPDLFGDIQDVKTEEAPGAFAGADSEETGINRQMDSADDILSLLDGLGEDNEDLADISSMLKADENHEAIEPDGGITAESVADSLANLGFEVNPEDADEFASLREIPSRQSETPGQTENVKSAKEKKGFLQKMKDLFFGPDEEELLPEPQSVVQEELLDVSDENLDILKALEGAAESAPAEDDPKAKKKAKKEEKKKAAAEKKEARAKEKEAKKKEKAAIKAAKPKKEKKPKVKDKTPPLPKKPVFLIFLLAASILFGVIFAGKGMNRRLAMNDSETYFSKGEYVKAYNEVAGLKVKDDNEKEVQYMEKIEMLAGVQELYDSYEVLLSTGRKELALDCLIRIIGHYDANIEKAGELGCSAELTEYEGLAEELLKETYHTSFEEALRIYRIRSRVRYSTELVKILKEAGQD